MDGIARLQGRADAAAWARRLREAALQDEAGRALDGALRTIDSFLVPATAQTERPPHGGPTTPRNPSDPRTTAA